MTRLTLTGFGKIKSAGSSRSTAHFSASAAAASYALSWPRRELPIRAVLEPVLFLKSLVFCRVFGMRWRCLLLKRCPLCEEWFEAARRDDCQMSRRRSADVLVGVRNITRR